ncbi:class A/C sortase [Enterococcus hulanensis]|uniref:sortase family protein n=1 Tax=Enterococcus hulanensis TaxID=2559929 RepID=UPI001A8FB139|nr:class C sortase [Enterococcus hulanensis]MBO0458335.1 class A/C sortase [Enterococcus hulanensis]
MKKNVSRNQTKRSRLVMRFATFMIVTGILVLLYPIVGNYLANQERSSASTDYDNTMKKMSKKEKEEQYQLARLYNQYVFDKQQGSRSEPMAYKSIIKNDSGVMGTVDIPAIDIEKMPFYHGTSYKTLDKGLGHLEGSSIPVGGKNTRSVITGHSGVKNQILFTDVKNLKEGDLFYINILGKRLAYQIDSFEEILPSESDKVKIVKGEDMVTLLTCTPPGINTYRLLVNGHRIPYKDAQKQKVKKRNIWSYQNVVVVTLAINFLLFLILVTIYHYHLKRFQSDNPVVVKKARKRLRCLFTITKIYFVLIFLAMLSILSVAAYGYVQMQEDTSLGTVDVGQEEQLNTFNLDKINRANYAEKQIASVNVANYAQARSNSYETTNNWGIGKLQVPKVDIDLPVLAGIANENLLTGAATYRVDQQLGKGNYVLLAHNIFEQDVLLHRIKKLTVGDKMYITDFKDIYTYDVSLNKVIEETEVSYVDSVTKDGKQTLTLLRCEGNIGTIYRRVVQGKLSSVQPIETASTQLLKEVGVKAQAQEAPKKLLNKRRVSPFQQFAMLIAAKFVSEPLQTMVPMFLFFLLPILFFSLIH